MIDAIFNSKFALVGVLVMYAALGVLIGLEVTK